jgi:anti-sigma28 factor (negative regulator of flagellin synthesis)
MKSSDYSRIRKRAADSIATPQAGPCKAAKEAGPRGIASGNARLSSQALTLFSSPANGASAARVDTIKARMASGAFEVDAGKVTDGLIKSARDLIRKRK